MTSSHKANSGPLGDVCLLPRIVPHHAFLKKYNKSKLFTKNPTRHKVGFLVNKIPYSLSLCGLAAFVLHSTALCLAVKEEFPFFHVATREKSQNDRMLLYWRAVEGKGSMDWKVTLLTHSKRKKRHNGLAEAKPALFFLILRTFLPLVWNPPLALQSNRGRRHSFDKRLNFAFQDEAL